MKARRPWLLLLSPCLGAWAAEPPRPGQDYHSVQIASSAQLPALQALYERYRHLPYLRLEQRGPQYTLRAGFWGSAQEARRALADLPIAGAQVRVAMLRPELLVQHNWETQTDVTSESMAAPTPKTPTVQAPHALAASPLQAPVAETPPPASSRDRAPPPPPQALRNSSPEDMALAYGVLVSTGDLQPAFQIAQAAVSAMPSDRAWRIKLAHVAEWTQRPQIAAQQWAALFALGARDTDTLNNVTRLAWQLDELAIPLAAWQTLAQKAPLSSQQALEVLKLFDESGEAAAGSLFFEDQYRQRGDLTLLEFAAQLSIHAGDDARTLYLQTLRSQLQPFSLRAVLDVVMAHVRGNRLPEALAFMQKHQDSIPAQAAEFWRLLGEIAWELQQTDTARQAYEKYVLSTSATVDDWMRLVTLGMALDPEQAARIALEAYRRFGTLATLTQALELYANAGNVSGLREAFALVQGEALARAESSPRFLLLRARYAQSMRQSNSAWSDLRRAMELDPRAKDVGLTGLWFLIEQQRTAELAGTLQHYAANAADADFWPAFGAANLVLNRQREALFWYRRSAARAPQDALLLLNYADALERNQHVGMAARVRRHAWLLLRERFAQETAPGKAVASDPQWRTMLRLSLLNRPGDPALHQVRAWVAQLRTLPHDATPNETTELVLAWAIGSEQFLNARTWMARQFRAQARSQAPVWGTGQVALQTGDMAALSALLREDAGKLPVYNRYDIERALGLDAQALDTAFQGLHHSPDDEALYDRVRQHAPAQAAYLQATLQDASLGSLARRTLAWDARWPLLPGWMLEMGGARASQSSSGADLQSLVPDADQVTRIGVRWSSPRQSGGLTLFQRRTWETQAGLHLDYAQDLGHGVRGGGRLDWHGESQISQAMQVAGMEDSLAANLGVQLDKRISLSVAPGFVRYYSQFGDELGSAQVLDGEAAYRLRMEYPDWRIRVTVRQQALDRTGDLRAESLQRLAVSPPNAAIGSSSYFLPESSTNWGLCMGLGDNLGGQNLHNGYSHGWRPFWDACLRNDSRTGDGYTSQLGLAGALRGRDHMLIELQHSDGLNTAEGFSRTLTVRYRSYF